MAYLASKGGVAQLTKSFALELAPFNIQVNAIAPCLFDTPLVSRARADSKEYFIEKTPAGRMGQPEDIVGAAVFLASDTASMVTGHILAVDGGYLIA
jgi:2-deoxy-D-gluconate 3-dehydrogenase